MKDFFDIISNHPWSCLFFGIGVLIAIDLICDMIVDVFKSFKK